MCIITFIMDRNNGLFIELDDFNFHAVNFPSLSRNIPSGLSRGV